MGRLTGIAELRRLAGIDTGPEISLEAIKPIGTAHHRKDGDWIKTDKGWVRVKKKGSQPTASTASPSAPPAPAKTSPAKAPEPASVPAKAAEPEDPKVRRAKIADAVVSSVTSAMKHLQNGAYDEAQYDEGTGWVQAAFRDWNLPKDPPTDEWDDPDYDSDEVAYYDNQVDAVLANAREVLAKKLEAHKDAIAKVSVSLGDKNWIEVSVKLK